MDFQNNRYFHSCCGRFHVKNATKILTLLSMLSALGTILGAIYFQSSYSTMAYATILYALVKLIFAGVAYQGVRNYNESHLIPYMGYLIFETVMSVCLAAFCIYGILEAEGLAKRFHNSTFEFRLDLDAVLVGQVFLIVFCVWALRVVQRCYQCIEGERAFARLFYPQTTAAKVKSRLIVT